VLIPYLGPEMATRLGAFWECCWVHGIGPRNPGHVSDIAPEILEELEHFGSVGPEPARTLLPNGKDEAATAAIDAERPSSQLSTRLASPSRSASPGSGMPAGPQAWRHSRRGTPRNPSLLPAQNVARLPRSPRRSEMRVWSDVVGSVINEPSLSYLKDRFLNIDDIIFDVASNLPSGADKPFYDPCNVEDLLYSAGARLERCVTYRREANELAIIGVKAELDYKTYNDLKTSENAAQKAALRVAQSKNEKDGFKSAAEQFGNAPLAAGFRAQARTISASAEITAEAETARSSLIDTRRAILDELNESMHARLGAPGSAHNFGDRWLRVVMLLKQDILIGYQKLIAAELGAKKFFNTDLRKFRQLPTPWKSKDNAAHGGIGFLDELVLWIRELLDLIDRHKQLEIDAEIVIPFVSAFKGTSGDVPALFTREEFKRAITSNRAFGVNLEGATDPFQGFYSIRLRSVALSFSHRPGT
jgi:hypothetical protein